MPMNESLFLRSLTLPSDREEINFLVSLKRTCYNGVYPFNLFPMKELSRLDFAPLTMLYGGNGSGKTTLLNVIAEACHVSRHSAFSGGAFFGDFAGRCTVDSAGIPPASQVLTSDDVFDFLLNVRYLNDGIDVRREELLEEWVDRKYASRRLASMADYEDWKESYDAKSRTQSSFVRQRLMRNVDMRSNGESALRYFTEHITENALYLLDEPENSLSVGRQKDLAEFLTASARYFGCQFVIATHSPLLLAMEGARIYDLDARPVSVRPWTELENVRAYREFFLSHESEFRD